MSGRQDFALNQFPHSPLTLQCPAKRGAFLLDRPITDQAFSGGLLARFEQFPRWGLLSVLAWINKRDIKTTYSASMPTVTYLQNKVSMPAKLADC